MNTQERETELGEGVTSAEFWVYDGKLGRRWNLDPIDQLFNSNYSTNGNNPIFFCDILGNIFGKGKEHVEEYKSVLKSKVAASRQEQEKIQKKIDNRIQKQLKKNPEFNIDKDKKITEWRQNLASEDKYQQGIQAIFDELEVLEKSAWTYDIEIAGQSSVPVGSGGKIMHDMSDDHIKVVLSEAMDFIEAISHELKHAYQFETRKLAFRHEGGSTLSYDKRDEIEAYKRSQFLGYYANQEIDLNFIINQSDLYAGLSDDNLIVGPPPAGNQGYWENYYFNAGAEGKELSDLIIINMQNWSEIYMRGYNSVAR